MTPEQRYETAKSLANQPEAVPVLVELLGDETEVVLDDGSYRDEDPTYSSVAAAAEESLRWLRTHAWPAIVAALPRASDELASRMVSILGGLQPEELRALPEDARRCWLERARALGRATPELEWEHAFARRTFPTAQALWAARVAEHPDRYARARAVRMLAEVATDKPAIALHIVPMLESAYLQNDAAWALCELPPVLPAEVVRKLAASRHPRERWDLLVGLARYGEPASALIDYCVELLVPFATPGLDEDRQWRIASQALAEFGALASHVHPMLRERLQQAKPVFALQARPIEVYLKRALGMAS